MRNILISLFLLCPILCMAQYSDKDLYAAYLSKDMSLWQRYLTQTEWSTLSPAEQARYLNYEYGYVATAIDTHAPDAKQLVARFGEHINAMTSVLPEATILTYRSAHAAYRAKLSVWELVSQGMLAFRYEHRALAADPTNALALTLAGNVYFYAPKILGGSKTKAHRYYQKAVHAYRQQGDTLNNWNYTFTTSHLTMAREKAVK